VNSTEKFLNYVAILHTFTCSEFTFCFWWRYFPAVMTGITKTMIILWKRSRSWQRFAAIIECKRTNAMSTSRKKCSMGKALCGF